MNRFAWMGATTVAHAASAATLVADAMLAPRGAAPDAAIVSAGGIDVLDLLKEGLLAPGMLVSLRGIPGLDAIEPAPDGGLRIGAMATLANLAADERIRATYPALAEAASGAASPQIRAVATAGGNLLQRPRCWYFRAAEFHCLRKGGGHCFALEGDNRYHAIFDNRLCAIVHPSTLATPLVALRARLDIAGPDGARRDVLLEDFLLSPGQDVQRENTLAAHEVVTSIILPPPAPGARMAYVKQAERAAFDWPLADVAVVLDVDAAGICRYAAIILGAAAPVPHRARVAEAALRGARIDDDVAREAASDALAGAEKLSGNGYKLQLFEALVRRAILQAAALLE